MTPSSAGSPVRHGSIRVTVAPDPCGLADAVGEYVANLATEAVAKRGRFCIALSGGSALSVCAAALTTPRTRARMLWRHWNVFWADERCVSLTHPDSNYARARQLLLRHVPIPASQVVSFDDTLSGWAAAAAYEDRIAGGFGLDHRDEPPRFDLIVLGVGADGHIASLFPGHSLLNESVRWVGWLGDAPKPPTNRITLTLPVLNEARNVAFVVCGKDKSRIVSRVFSGSAESACLPARLVQPTQGTVHWFLDAAADEGRHGAVADRHATEGIA